MFNRLLGILGCCCLTLAAQSYLITGAQIADGSGSPLQRADLRIKGDRIAEVGRLQPKTGEMVIHGEALVLAPGFIDAHNHSTEALDTDPAAENQVSQGITTALLGQDGGSPLPVGASVEKRRAHPFPRSTYR